MKKTLVFPLLLIASITICAAQEISLNVDAATSIATSSPLFNGANIEDINNQTNGGV